jgi:hypothetical protein
MITVIAAGINIIMIKPINIMAILEFCRLPAALLRPARRPVRRRTTRGQEDSSQDIEIIGNSFVIMAIKVLAIFAPPRRPAGGPPQPALLEVRRQSGRGEARIFLNVAFDLGITMINIVNITAIVIKVINITTIPMLIEPLLQTSRCRRSRAPIRGRG